MKKYGIIDLNGELDENELARIFGNVQSLDDLFIIETDIPADQLEYEVIRLACISRYGEEYIEEVLGSVPTYETSTTKDWYEDFVEFDEIYWEPVMFSELDGYIDVPEDLEDDFDAIYVIDTD